MATDLESFWELASCKVVTYLWIKQLTGVKDKDMKPPSFALTIYTMGRIYQRQISSQDLKSLASDLSEKSISKYVDQTIAALFAKKDVPPTNPFVNDHFVHDIAFGDGSVTLRWKQVLPDEDDMQYLLGSVKLDLVSDSDERAKAQNDLFKRLTGKIAATQTRLSESEEQVDVLKAELVAAQEKFDTATIAKEEFEREVYDKFAVILNSKKAKIRELEALLEPRSNSRTQKPATKAAIGPDDETPSEGEDTDVESLDVRSNSSRKRKESDDLEEEEREEDSSPDLSQNMFDFNQRPSTSKKKSASTRRGKAAASSSGSASKLAVPKLSRDDSASSQSSRKSARIASKSSAGGAGSRRSAKPDTFDDLE